MARCRYCSTEVTWMKEGRKNVPVEHDGTTHKCEIMEKSLKSFKKMTPSSLSAEEIKKYEEAMNNQKSKTKK